MASRDLDDLGRRRAELRLVGCALWYGEAIDPGLIGAGKLHVIATAIADAHPTFDVDERIGHVVDRLRQMDQWGGDAPHAPGVSWADLGRLIVASLDDGDPEIDREHLAALARGRRAIDEISSAITWARAGDAAAVREAAQRLVELADAAEAVSTGGAA